MKGYYKYRTWKHKFIRSMIFTFCKFMFFHYVADKKIVKITYKEDGFDPYTYCEYSMKKYCPVGTKKKYQLYIKYYGYAFYGCDEYECYLNALKSFYSSVPVIFPHNKRWTVKSGEEYIS